jgi:hypothetical protein
LSFDRPFPYERGQASPPSGPLVYKINRLGRAGWELAQTVGPSGKRYSFAQPLPGGRWLLVESRLAQDRSPNADIFDEKGNLLLSIVAGDGIEHIQTTMAGDIWIGYFDEGVYSGGELEHSGLVCLTEQGQPCLRYWSDIAQPNRLPCIDDCYAINVSGENEVWAVYYSHFPVVRLRHKTLDKAWLDFPAKAVRAFAVDTDRLLMTPAYRREGPLYLTNLQDSSIEEIQVLDSLGHPLHFDRSFGRGPLLCFASLQTPENQRLFTIDLRTI